MEFASQISISLQQEPYSPVPAFGSLADAFHPTELACDTVSTVFQPEVLKRDPRESCYLEILNRVAKRALTTPSMNLMS
jgi:hypothetical protein